MSRTVHVCTGCGAELAARRDMAKEIGAVYSSWSCAHCGTRVPGVVAEKLKHQTQN